MKLGIMQQYYGQRPIKEIASAIKKDGFRCVQLSLVDENGAIPTQQLGAEDGSRFRNAFEAAEVEICALSGYTNLVDTNEARRKKRLARFHAILKSSHHYGSNIVATETGSMNPESEWAVYHTEEAFDRLHEILAESVKIARDYGTIIALEGYVKNVLDTPEKTLRLIEEFGSDVLGVVMDPNNYIFPSQADDIDGQLHHIFNLIGKYTKIAHAKDYTVKPDGDLDTPRAGTGILNYPLFVEENRYVASDTQSHSGNNKQC